MFDEKQKVKLEELYAYLEKYYKLDKKAVNSVTFRIVDFLMMNATEEAIDVGAYHNSPLNGDTNMIESYQAILWAMYEEMDGKTPEAAGPWVTLDHENGFGIHKDRPYKN